jgi:hypothetical protein
MIMILLLNSLYNVYQFVKYHWQSSWKIESMNWQKNKNKNVLKNVECSEISSASNYTSQESQDTA